SYFPECIIGLLGLSQVIACFGEVEIYLCESKLYPGLVAIRCRDISNPFVEVFAQVISSRRLSVGQGLKAVIYKAIFPIHKGFDFPPFPVCTVIQYGCMKTRLQQFVWRRLCSFPPPIGPVWFTTCCQFILFNHLLRRTCGSSVIGPISPWGKFSIEGMIRCRQHISKL